MKIEKINDNQIRCTLTREDLENHQIRLSELAYGTEKAKSLFRDMMQQAHAQFGFEADNIPLMIEAIPLNSESILLIITKVEDPEELDTRFSKFAPSAGNNDAVLQLDGADSIIDIFQKIYEARAKAAGKKPEAKSENSNASSSAKKEAPAITVNLVYIYRFPDLDTIIEAAHSLNHFYQGTNALYKDSKSGVYQLVVHQSSYTPEEFNKVCNILSEFGQGKAFSNAGEAHLIEHGEVILPQEALQQLSKL
ncbi:MAG: adaptor protein MecA [Blautia sp.]